MNILQMMMQIKRNPAMLAELLFKQGAVDQNTYDQIKNMTPSQMGQHLMNQGLIDPGIMPQMPR